MSEKGSAVDLDERQGWNGQILFCARAARSLQRSKQTGHRGGHQRIQVDFFASAHDEETCRYCDLGKESAFDDLIDLCRDRGLVLVDLASGAQGRFERWLNDRRSAEQVHALNIEITMFFMVNGEPETVAALARGIKALENIGQIIAVKNSGRATDFAVYDQDPVSTTLSQRSAVIDLPKLELAKSSFTRSRIRFRDAIPTGSRSEEVGFFDSRRIDVFLKSAKSQLALVKTHLS